MNFIDKAFDCLVPNQALGLGFVAGIGVTAALAIYLKKTEMLVGIATVGTTAYFSYLLGVSTGKENMRKIIKKANIEHTHKITDPGIVEMPLGPGIHKLKL